MRGTLYWSLRFAASPGIIPACAGNTSIFKKENLYWGDHPRVCGEHAGFVVPFDADGGSSPRVRGTLLWNGDNAVRYGIIPACAGNTLHGRLRSLPRRDHPRVCGEHLYSFACHAASSGSSPRVRGTRWRAPSVRVSSGIIPACAGNTGLNDESRKHGRDHPRVCGEHSLAYSLSVGTLGSSPRVRGTQQFVQTVGNVVGIIPACAGNTSAPTSSLTDTRDHPRVCGEHFKHYGVPLEPEGSSPRVRGTHYVFSDIGGKVGIIPACAGNTDYIVYIQAVDGDHPRVCGEHSLPPGDSPKTMGSSPRVRGTPLVMANQGKHDGIIPACAGNTLFR